MNDYDKEGEITIYLLCGLPRSGKSTKAKELSKIYNAPIISMDAIRLAIHGNPYIEKTEPFIKLFERYTILALIYAGHKSIIIDSCNLNLSETKEYLLNLFKETNFKIHINEIIITTSKDVCIARAIESNQEYLIPIINELDVDHLFNF